MNKKILFIVLALAFSMMFTAVVPAFAKNLNYPSDTIVEYYYGGRAHVDLPTPLPTNYPPTATAMRLIFHHVVIPNAGLDYTDLQVSFSMTTFLNPIPHWEEFCILTTSPYSAAFNRVVWHGTMIHLDASYLNLPTPFDTDNVILVDEDVLQVEKHGNRMYASLNAPQQIDSMIINLQADPPIVIPNVYFTLYPFTLELSKYGGSTHYAETWTFDWLGTTGYTFTVEEMYFNANGEFTCPELYPDAVTVDNARVVMKGIHTYSPP